MRVIEPGKGRVWIGVAGDRIRVELRDDETPVGTFELDTRSLVRLESGLDNGTRRRSRTPQRTTDRYMVPSSIRCCPIGLTLPTQWSRPTGRSSMCKYVLPMLFNSATICSQRPPTRHELETDLTCPRGNEQLWY